MIRERRLAAVPTREVFPDPANPRDDVGDVSELAASMRSVGLLQPIVVRRTASGRLVVLAGHRRLAAAQLLKWPTVQVVINGDLAPDQTLVAMLVENGQRAGLDPIEEARAYRRILNAGHTWPELARMVGRSEFTIAKRMQLLSLPEAEQEAVRAGVVSLREAGEKATRVRAPGSQVHRPATQASRNWHFDHRHPLAETARARCSELQHKPGRKASGGVACGECWEAIIREDERTAVTS